MVEGEIKDSSCTPLAIRPIKGLKQKSSKELNRVLISSFLGASARSKQVSSPKKVHGNRSRTCLPVV